MRPLGRRCHSYVPDARAFRSIHRVPLYRIHLAAAAVWLELRPAVLERALHPFPVPMRTLDALHLASLAFLREHGKEVRLATYDERMAEAAMAMGVALESV